MAAFEIGNLLALRRIVCQLHGSMLLMNKKIGVVLGLAALLGLYLYFQVDWDARAIRSEFKQLVDVVEKDGPVSSFEALGRSRKLVGHFAPKASVEYFPGRGLPKDLDGMGAAFLSVWTQIETASVSVQRHEVEIDPRGMEAESMVQAKCSVIFEGAERMGDTLKYRIYWVKIDGDWKIRTVLPLLDR